MLTAAQQKYQLKDFNQLGQGVAKAGATIKTFEVDLNQSINAIGVFNDAGMAGSEAGTGFNAVMRNMSRASEEFGFQIVRNADGAMDLAKTINGLNEATSNMDVQERADALQKAFGDEGLKGAVALMDATDKLNTSLDANLDKETAKFQAELDYQAAINKRNDTVAMLGSTILPALTKINTTITTTIAKVSGIIERFPILGDVAVYGTAGIIGLSLAIHGASMALNGLKTIGAIAQLIKGFSLVTTIATAKQWALNIAMMANPVGLIIAGIAALIGIGILLIKNWDTVKVWWGKMWGGIKKAGIGVWNFMKKMFGWSPLGLIIKAYGKAFAWLNDKFKIFDKIKKGIASVKSFFGGDDNQRVSSTDNSRRGRSRGAQSGDLMTSLKEDARAINANGSNASYTNAQKVNINIQQLPGESQEDLAQRTREIIQEEARQQESASYSDGLAYS